MHKAQGIKKHDKYAVLLAGGQGSRFWPQSRILEPKQFISLYKKTNLFEQSVKRIRRLIPSRNILISSSELYRTQILEYARIFNIPRPNLIFEPEGKNTAPSIGVAARLIHLRDPQARVCMLPCDHLIQNEGQFLKIIDKALNICGDNLVIFGIPPYRAATGYGYIKVTKPQSQGVRSKGLYSVDKFCEKPNLKTARRFLKAGGYFWNSGIFAGAADTFLREIGKHLPELHRKLENISVNSDITRDWKAIKSISFDYGVMEKTRSLLMLKVAKIGWLDLGSWQAWDEIIPKDKEGNAFKGDIISLDSRNITALSQNRLIAAIGLENLIVVDTPDALLITKKERSEDVKKIVDILKANKRQEHYLHLTVHRPWGHYTVLNKGQDFKIKLVEVKPHRSLSLQLHKKRSEHWIIVEGRAKIIRGGKSYCVNSNESTFIPVSCVHRLINPDDTVLRLVEVQSGRYLEEDDIIRLKDDFERI